MTVIIENQVSAKETIFQRSGENNRMKQNSFFLFSLIHICILVTMSTDAAPRSSAKGQTNQEVSAQLPVLRVYDKQQFIKYVENDDLAKVSQLVKENPAYLNITGDDDWTPVFFAARFGRIKVLRFLLESGAEVDRLDMHGFAPLHHASSNNQQEAVKVLLDKGAKINLRCRVGVTATRLAYSNGHTALENYLKSRGGMR